MLLQSLPTVIGAAAVLPALTLLWLVVAIDHRPEPPGLVFIAFLFGIVALFLTRYLVAFLHPLEALARVSGRQ
jgi:protease PrsW